MDIREEYRRASRLTGEFQDGAEVQYRSTLSDRERRASNAWMFAVFILGVALISTMILTATCTILGRVAVGIMVLIEVIRITQTATLWAFARKAADPVPMSPQAGLRVAVHTTIVPGKEPFDVVARTLLAMKSMTYPGGLVHVWLLDEGDDPFIKKWCIANGVHHFSRKGHPEWNTPSGPFKAKTKHGNLNAFHAAHGHKYDIVAQMDPDHVPSPDFLERTLGYFRDPGVAFVVAPQVYGNGDKSWIAGAAAFQAYVFHGVVQRGGNGMRAPLLIGTNHLVRVKALRDIGGYADNIIEDHLTSMEFYRRKRNSDDYWKGVYIPDIVSIGEGPTSFADFFNQQMRWAYGIWQIAQIHSPRMFGAMQPVQRVAFAGLQFFYPSIALSWILSFILSLMVLAGDSPTQSSGLLAASWVASTCSTLGFFWWLRRFNLVEHEKKEWGLRGMALLLMCIPVYVAAGVQAVMRRKLTYVVTAKGNLASSDSLRTFAPQQIWLGMIVGSVAITTLLTRAIHPIALVWFGWMALVCIAPIAVHVRALLKRRYTPPIGESRRVDVEKALEVVDSSAR